MAEAAVCSSYFKCKQKDCPAHGVLHGKCWLIPGTSCRDSDREHGREKIERCLECPYFRENISEEGMEETWRQISRNFRELRQAVEARDRELEATNLEMAIGFSEVLEALRAIASGDPSVRIGEESSLEIIAKLKHMVNRTAENLGEIVDLSHEFAIGLAEHFDVLHRVSKGDLTARVDGQSSVDLLNLLKKMTNEMIENISVQMSERLRVEEALKLNEMRLEALLRLNQMTKAPLRELCDFALEQGTRLTGSQTGYFAFMNEDESLLTLHVWPKESKPQHGGTDLGGLPPVAGTGPWSEAVQRRRPIIANDDSTFSSWSNGGSQGHVALQRHLNVPLLDGDRIVMVAGVGNKSVDYHESDVRQLTLLMSDLWRILQRKQAEEALRESEEKYRLLIGNLPAITFNGYADGHIEFFDDKIEALTGYAPDEFNSGRIKWTDIVLEEDGEEFRTAFQRALTGDRSYVREYRITTREGKILWLQGRGRIICDPDGHIDYVSGVIFDITERKQGEDLRRKLEMQLNQALKMEAIGTLAGGIAHDFNNILSAIIGYAELVQLTLLRAPQQGQALSHLGEILRAGSRAKDLVNQILTFSRQTEQMRKPVEVCLIIEEVLRFLRASIPSTVEIRSSLNAHGGIVMADPVQIHQVLLNLCTNAFQSMEGQRGVLEIRVDPVEVDSRMAYGCPDLSAGQYIRITVSDTGQGMAPAVLERIFDPFFTTKQPGKGTGLGLSVVHGIVKGLGGAILVESEIGKGATFQIFLPRHAAAAGRETVEAARNLSGSERILLVDDEIQLTEMTRMALGQFGYRVTTFNNSLDAMEAFRARPRDFDLVITDLTMPHLTGIELARAIKRLRSDVPILLVTGFSEDTAWQKAKEVGVERCLLKPIIISDLIKALRLALDAP